MALQTLFEQIGEMAEKDEEKRNEMLCSAFDNMSAEYLKKLGEPARIWVKNHIMNIKGAKLDEPTANRVVDHIANGHASFVKELLWADLVDQGMKRDKAEKKARSVNSSIPLLFLYEELDSESKSVMKAGTPSKEAANMAITIGFPSFLKQQLICPNCYRIIRKWNRKTGIEDMGPSHVKCEECGKVIPTFFTPWNKKSKTYKIISFGLPMLFIVGDLVGSIFLARNIYCIGGSILFFIVGLFWAYQTWRQKEESLTVPTW
jgi:hypothetical protein